MTAAASLDALLLNVQDIINKFGGKKMKEFKEPKMLIQKLEREEFIMTSGCWEAFDCKKCYNDAVICGEYECTGLVCNCLGALHI